MSALTDLVQEINKFASQNYGERPDAVCIESDRYKKIWCDFKTLQRTQSVDDEDYVMPDSVMVMGVPVYPVGF